MKCKRMQEEALRTLPLLFQCQEENDHLKISTPYLYPNGDYVDFYLIETPTGRYLTDLGETMGYLADHKVSIRQSSKRRRIVNDVLLTQGVELFQGELRMPFDDWDNAAWNMTRLGQAIVQISDLVFNVRVRSLVTFKEEVEQYWIENGVPYEVDYAVPGGSGQLYTIDFYIATTHRPHFVETLSTESTSYANNLVNRVVRTWHDLHRANGRHDYISLVDDSVDVWKEPWLDQLAELSDVVVWSEREKLLRRLGR